MRRYIYIYLCMQVMHNTLPTTRTAAEALSIVIRVQSWPKTCKSGRSRKTDIPTTCRRTRAPLEPYAEYPNKPPVPVVYTDEQPLCSREVVRNTHGCGTSFWEMRCYCVGLCFALGGYFAVYRGIHDSDVMMRKYGSFFGEEATEAIVIFEISALKP